MIDSSNGSSSNADPPTEKVRLMIELKIKKS